MVFRFCEDVGRGRRRLRARGPPPVARGAASAASVARCSIWSSPSPFRSTALSGRALPRRRGATHRASSVPDPYVAAQPRRLPRAFSFAISASRFGDFFGGQLPRHHLDECRRLCRCTTCSLCATRSAGIEYDEYGDAVVRSSNLYHSHGLCACASAMPADNASRTVSSAFTRRSNLADRREFAPENRHTPLDCQGTRSHLRGSRSRKRARVTVPPSAATAVRPGATDFLAIERNQHAGQVAVRLPHQCRRLL